MVAVTVISRENGVERNETFDIDLESTTVAAFRQELAEHMGWRSFNMYLKLAVGECLLKMKDDDAKILSSVGVAEGSVFRLARNKTAAEWRQFRLKNIDRNVKDMGKDVKEVVGILRGEAGPRREGMTAAARLDQNVLTVRTLQTENRKLREEMREDGQRAKIARSEAVAQSAGEAQAQVDLAMGNLTGDDIEQKEHVLREQLKTLAVAKREKKKEERKAAAKAKGKANRRGKRAEEAVGQVGQLDQDQKEEAFDIQEEMVKAIDDFAAAQIVQDE